MNKQDRLKNLSPAASVARVFHADSGDQIQVLRRYVQKPRGWSCFGVNRESGLWGVPYAVWEAHLGRMVRLWEWHGTAEGMIGGPAKRQVGHIWWAGVAEFPMHYPAASLLETADALEEWTKDDRYEFPSEELERVKRMIRELRSYAAHPDWHGMSYAGRYRLMLEFENAEEDEDARAMSERPGSVNGL